MKFSYYFPSSTWCSALALCVAVLLAGCGGSADTSAGGGLTAPTAEPALVPAAPQPAPGGLELLPRPSALPRDVSGVLTDSDRLRQGEQWNAELPRNRVEGKTYSPQYAGAAGRTLDDAAYAVYRFNDLDQYGGPAQLQLGWEAGGDTAQVVWIGMANFAKDRWDWFEMPANWKVALPGFANYVDDIGRTYAAVVSLDNGTFALDYVLAGTNTPPVVEVTTSLDADPLQNIAPLTVSFDATASRSYGGTLTGFDFDWEGDGTWDETGDPDGLGIHQYAAGNYEATIRATDNLGQQTELVISFAAIDTENLPPSANFTRTPSSGNAPLIVQLNGAPSTDPDGYIMLYEWDFDNNGSWDLSSDEPTAQYTYGIAGANQVRLRVTDNFYAQSTMMLTVDVVQGWHTNIIHHAETRHRIAMCSTGSGADERACIAYQEFNNRDLRFARALNAEASAWSSYVHPVPPAADTGYSPAMDRTTSGTPLIAYGVGAVGYPLYVVNGTDETGSSWDEPVLVDGAGGLGLELDLAVINSIPCIAASNLNLNPGASKVLFFTSQDGVGGAWNAPQEAMPPTAAIRYRSVNLGKSSTPLFKRPILACGTMENLAYLGTAIAAAVDPAGTDWNLPTFYLGWTDAGSIVDVDGRPAFCGAGPGVSEPNAYFVRANDGTGTSWPLTLTSIAGGASSAELMIVADKPVVCFQDYLADKLCLVSALDAEGTVWDEPYVIGSTVGEWSATLNTTLVAGKPVICFAYYLEGVAQIRSVSWY